MTDFARFKRAEREAAAELAAAWGAEAVETEEYCSIDWLLIKGGQLKACAEFKDRTVGDYASTDIDPFLINLDKIIALQAAGSFFKVPALLVSRCTDGVFYCDVRQLPIANTIRGGRRDRDPVRFPNDYGDRVKIPVAICSRLKK